MEVTGGLTLLAMPSALYAVILHLYAVFPDSPLMVKGEVGFVALSRTSTVAYPSLAVSRSILYFVAELSVQVS